MSSRSRRSAPWAMSPDACSRGAEVPAEGELLLVVDVLIAEYQDAEPVHPRVDGGGVPRRQPGSQINARDLADEVRALCVCRREGERHRGFVPPRRPRRASALILRGRECHRDPVHAVAQPGRRRTVLEDMPEMALAAAAMHLGPAHEEAAIGPRLDRAVDRRPKAPPPRCRSRTSSHSETTTGRSRRSGTTPGRFSRLSGDVPARSVPCFRRTRYCPGVRRACHASSVITRSVSVVSLLMAASLQARLWRGSSAMPAPPRRHPCARSTDPAKSNCDDETARTSA